MEDENLSEYNEDTTHNMWVDYTKDVYEGNLDNLDEDY